MDLDPVLDIVCIWGIACLCLCIRIRLYVYVSNCMYMSFSRGRVICVNVHMAVSIN